MATSTGKKARKRYGNRYAAKRVGGRGDSTKRPRQRRTWGKLPFSVAAGNVPQAAVNANEALMARIYDERRRNGWEDDANVMVPGPTRASRPRIQEEHVD